MAVLVRTRKELRHYCRVLTSAGIEWVNLLDYDGVTIDRVKIGTFKRAKGLEFKYVLLPGLREPLLEPWAGESEAAFQERSERTRRELFVGMTRARDGLWLGYLDS
jgi:superfamily I DNA/RNA helicase